MFVNYQSIVSVVVVLVNDLNSVFIFVCIIGVMDFICQMVVVVFVSVVCQDVENVCLMIFLLVQVQQFNEDQIQELCDIVVWCLMGSDVIEEQVIWCDDVIMCLQFMLLVEWWVWMVLGMGDCYGFNIWLVCLLMEVKEKDEWCYWQVDLLLECGRDEEVQVIFCLLM